MKKERRASTKKFSKKKAKEVKEKEKAMRRHFYRETLSPELKRIWKKGRNVVRLNPYTSEEPTVKNLREATIKFALRGTKNAKQN